MTSTSSQSLNVPGSNEYHRQSTSSGSSIPEITIQPPSRPSSDHHDPPAVGASHLLSPDHAHNALPPIDRPSSRRADPNPPLVPTVPNTPVIPQHIFEYLPDGNLPAGFTPIGLSNPLPPLDAPQTGSTIPIPIPPPFSSSYSSGGSAAAPFPANTREYPPSPSGRTRETSSPIPGHGTLYRDMPRPSSATGSSSRPKTPWSNIYTTAPIPAGVTYPQAPGITGSSSAEPSVRYPLSGSSAGNLATNSPGHRRSISLNAGQTPNGLNRSKTLPTASLDPAHDSFYRETITEANTFANTGGSRPTTSSALSYAFMPGFS